MHFLNASQPNRRFLDDLRFTGPPAETRGLWGMKESSDSNVSLFSHCCCSAQTCTLCLNQRPSACLAKIKTFTNSDLSHCEAMTSFIPHLGPCHLVTLVEPITDGWRHTVTSQFLMSTRTRALCTFIACHRQPRRSYRSRKRLKLALRFWPVVGVNSTFFSEQ